MGWQWVNVKIDKATGDRATASPVMGYFVGTGHEQGYYCFPNTPYFDSPIISDSLCPRLEFSDGVVLRPSPVSYEGETVWAYTGGPFAFRSRERGAAKRIRMEELREPYWYTDLDGETLVGDTFFEGAMPQLNAAAPTTWTLEGAVNEGEEDSVDVELKQDVWEWHDNGDVTDPGEIDMAGRYYNEEDGSWKSVGVPEFKASAAQTSPFHDESFSREAEKDENDRLVYRGGNGHVIRHDADAGKWVVGTVGSGTWAESSTAPSVGGTARFAGKRWNEDTEQAEDDHDWDFSLEWKHNVLGDMKRELLVGEVSLWRP